MVVKDDSADLFKGFGIEIQLPPEDKGEFLKIKETLTRIGIADNETKTLYQTCHIFHKRGRYVIIHFKELRAFDGKPSNISDTDLARRNTITSLLEKFKLLIVIEKTKLEPQLEGGVTILPFKEKSNWILKSKYVVGTKFKKSS